MFDPSNRGDVLAAYQTNALRQMRERNEVEARRRSAQQAAQEVADWMVSSAALNFPNLFGARDLRPLRSLIAAWILRGD